LSESGGYLLLRRAGVLWGIENSAVEGLARRGGMFRIELGAQNGAAGAVSAPSATSAIIADEILCVVDSLRVLPVAAVLRRFWPATAAGLTGVSVHGEQPLMVVDPQHPPQLLRPEGATKEREGTDGERE
jgi:hypothetical protein